MSATQLADGTEASATLSSTQAEDGESLVDVSVMSVQFSHYEQVESAATEMDDGILRPADWAQLPDDEAESQAAAVVRHVMSPFSGASAGDVVCLVRYLGGGSPEDSQLEKSSANGTALHHLTPSATGTDAPLSSLLNSPTSRSESASTAQSSSGRAWANTVPSPLLEQLQWFETASLFGISATGVAAGPAASALHAPVLTGHRLVVPVALRGSAARRHSAAVPDTRTGRPLPAVELLESQPRSPGGVDLSIRSGGASAASSHADTVPPDSMSVPGAVLSVPVCEPCDGRGTATVSAVGDVAVLELLLALRSPRDGHPPAYTQLARATVSLPTQALIDGPKVLGVRVFAGQLVPLAAAKVPSQGATFVDFSIRVSVSHHHDRSGFEARLREFLKVRCPAAIPHAHRMVSAAGPCGEPAVFAALRTRFALTDFKRRAAAFFSLYRLAHRNLVTSNATTSAPALRFFQQGDTDLNKYDAAAHAIAFLKQAAGLWNASMPGAEEEALARLAMRYGPEPDAVPFDTRVLAFLRAYFPLGTDPNAVGKDRLRWQAVVRQLAVPPLPPAVDDDLFEGGFGATAAGALQPGRCEDESDGRGDSRARSSAPATETEQRRSILIQRLSPADTIAARRGVFASLFPATSAQKRAMTALARLARGQAEPSPSVYLFGAEVSREWAEWEAQQREEQLAAEQHAAIRERRDAELQMQQHERDLELLAERRRHEAEIDRLRRASLGRGGQSRSGSGMRRSESAPGGFAPEDSASNAAAVTVQCGANNFQAPFRGASEVQTSVPPTGHTNLPTRPRQPEAGESPELLAGNGRRGTLTTSLAGPGASSHSRDEEGRSQRRSPSAVAPAGAFRCHADTAPSSASHDQHDATTVSTGEVPVPCGIAVNTGSPGALALGPLPPSAPAAAATGARDATAPQTAVSPAAGSQQLSVSHERGGSCGRPVSSDGAPASSRGHYERRMRVMMNVRNREREMLLRDRYGPRGGSAGGTAAAAAGAEWDPVAAHHGAELRSPSRGESVVDLSAPVPLFGGRPAPQPLLIATAPLQQGAGAAPLALYFAPVQPQTAISAGGSSVPRAPSCPTAATPAAVPALTAAAPPLSPPVDEAEELRRREQRVARLRDQERLLQAEIELHIRREAEEHRRRAAERQLAEREATIVLEQELERQQQAHRHHQLMAAEAEGQAVELARLEAAAAAIAGRGRGAGARSPEGAAGSLPPAGVAAPTAEPSAASEPTESPSRSGVTSRAGSRPAADRSARGSTVNAARSAGRRDVQLETLRAQLVGLQGQVERQQRLLDHHRATQAYSVAAPATPTVVENQRSAKTPLPHSRVPSREPVARSVLGGTKRTGAIPVGETRNSSTASAVHPLPAIPAPAVLAMGTDMREDAAYFRQFDTPRADPPLPAVPIPINTRGEPLLTSGQWQEPEQRDREDRREEAERITRMTQRIGVEDLLRPGSMTRGVHHLEGHLVRDSESRRESLGAPDMIDPSTVPTQSPAAVPQQHATPAPDRCHDIHQAASHPPPVAVRVRDLLHGCSEELSILSGGRQPLSPQPQPQADAYAFHADLKSPSLHESPSGVHGGVAAGFDGNCQWAGGAGGGPTIIPVDSMGSAADDGARAAELREAAEAGAAMLRRGDPGAAERVWAMALSQAGAPGAVVPRLSPVGPNSTAAVLELQALRAETAGQLAEAAGLLKEAFDTGAATPTAVCRLACLVDADPTGAGRAVVPETFGSSAGRLGSSASRTGPSRLLPAKLVSPGGVSIVAPSAAIRMGSLNTDRAGATDTRCFALQLYEIAARCGDPLARRRAVELRQKMSIPAAVPSTLRF